MTTVTESTVEAAAFEWLANLGWQVAHGPDIAPDVRCAESYTLRPKLVSGEWRMGSQEALEGSAKQAS